MSKNFDIIKFIFRKISRVSRNWFLFVSAVIVSLIWITYVNKTPLNDSKTLTADFSNSDLLFDFLNVGNADCAIVHNKDAVIIIDGGKRLTDDKVVSFLKDEVFKNMNSNKEINLMVLTHPHEDHYGGLVKVVSTFDVKRFITSDLEVDFSTHSGLKKLFDILGGKKIKIEHPKYGDHFKFGGIRVEILGPIKKDKENVNNNSIVLKISYAGKKFLFTGDAEKPEERDLINSNQDLSADVIKIGHHGSKTSTSEKFLFKVHPKFAVISTEDERYPYSSVVKAFNSYSSSVNGQFDYFITRDFDKSVRFAVTESGELKAPKTERTKKEAA